MTLGTNEEACHKLGIANAGEVDDLVVLDIDKGLGTVGPEKKYPIISGSHAWFPHGTSACLQVTYPLTYDIPPDEARRLRVDVQSTSLKKQRYTDTTVSVTFDAGTQSLPAGTVMARGSNLTPLGVTP